MRHQFYLVNATWSCQGACCEVSSKWRRLAGGRRRRLTKRVTVSADAGCSMVILSANAKISGGWYPHAFLDALDPARWILMLGISGLYECVGAHARCFGSWARSQSLNTTATSSTPSETGVKANDIPARRITAKSLKPSPTKAA